MKRTLRNRILTLAPAKLLLGLGLTAGFLVGYARVQRWPAHEPLPPLLTPVDGWIPFQPAWIAVYLTLYPVMAVAWLATTREQLVRYALGFTGISLVAFACFHLWPIRAPRPDALPETWIFELLAWLDEPYNTPPSLHVAFAVFHARLLERLARPRAAVRAGLWAWVVLVSYATLATKQHALVDVPAGAGLGFAGDAAAGWRRRREGTA